MIVYLDIVNTSLHRVFATNTSCMKHVLMFLLQPQLMYRKIKCNKAHKIFRMFGLLLVCQSNVFLVNTCLLWLYMDDCKLVWILWTAESFNICGIILISFVVSIILVSFLAIYLLIIASTPCSFVGNFWLFVFICWKYSCHSALLVPTKYFQQIKLCTQEYQQVNLILLR